MFLKQVCLALCAPHPHNPSCTHAQDLELLAGVVELGGNARAKGLLLGVLLGLERKGFLSLLHVAVAPAPADGAQGADRRQSQARASAAGTVTKTAGGVGTAAAAVSSSGATTAPKALVRDPVFGFGSPAVRHALRSSVLAERRRIIDTRDFERRKRAIAALAVTSRLRRRSWTKQQISEASAILSTAAEGAPVAVGGGSGGGGGGGGGGEAASTVAGCGGGALSPRVAAAAASVGFEEKASTSTAAASTAGATPLNKACRQWACLGLPLKARSTAVAPIPPSPRSIAAHAHAADLSAAQFQALALAPYSKSNGGPQGGARLRLRILAMQGLGPATVAEVAARGPRLRLETGGASSDADGGAGGGNGAAAGSSAVATAAGGGGGENAFLEVGFDDSGALDDGGAAASLGVALGPRGGASGSGLVCAGTMMVWVLPDGLPGDDPSLRLAAARGLRSSSSNSGSVTAAAVSAVIGEDGGGRRHAAGWQRHGFWATR